MHGHVFPGRVGRVLREEAPDVLDKLLDSGIEKADYDFGKGFELDVSPMSRRPVFEAVLRRIVRGQGSVQFRSGVRVTGLESTDGSGVPRVVGLRTRASDRIASDLVLDCCGRRSVAQRWRNEIGSRLPVNHYQSCDLYYFARHDGLRAGARFPGTTIDDVDLTPYGIFLAMPEDNGTFCLAVVYRRPTLIGQHCPMEPSLSASRLPFPASLHGWKLLPITEVQLMGGIANRRRSLMDGNNPVVEGYILLGDASLYTNATLGQGPGLLASSGACTPI